MTTETSVISGNRLKKIEKSIENTMKIIRKYLDSGISQTIFHFKPVSIARSIYDCKLI